MLKRLKRAIVKDDIGLGDTVARFTHWAQLPEWLKKQLPHWLYRRLPDRLPLDQLAYWLIVDVLRFKTCGCQNRQRRLNVAVPFRPVTLTIGLPHRDDVEGVWATVEHLATEIDTNGLADRVEILVADQSPPAEGQPNPLKGFCAAITRRGLRCRYVLANQQQGSAAAKNQVFFRAEPFYDEGDSDALKAAKRSRHFVICLDCHVHLAPGSLRQTYDYLARQTESADLYYGVLLMDDSATKGWTHFKCWRPDRQPWQAPTPHIGGDLLMGHWQTDKRGLNPNEKPFEIEASGGWFIICRRDAWVGFHPLLTGHGGEEWYLAEAFRQLDRKVMSLPCARGWHRFIRGPQNRPNYGGDHLTLRNHVICFKALGYDIDRLRRGWTWPLPNGVPLRDPDWVDEHIAMALAEYAEHDAERREAQRQADERRKESQQQKQAPANRAGCSLKKVPADQVASRREAEYRTACIQPSDINEHLPVLRSLAEKVERVTEFGTRSGVSLRAFLAAQPAELHSYDIATSGCAVGNLQQIAGDTKLMLHHGPDVGDTLKAEIEPTGLLFIDTLHTGPQVEAELDRHADKVRHFLVFHDTATFGVHGEGHTDEIPVEGLAEGIVRWRQRHPEWQLVEVLTNNNGLTIYRRTDSGLTWSLAEVEWPSQPAEGADIAAELPPMVVTETFGD
jgi:hypothetical protein